MGDITQALRSAQSGLLANQQALNTIANNVANVNTEGYSRKLITMESQAVAGVGSGVNVSEIKRIVDEGLLKTIRIENGELNELTVKNDYFDRLQDLFGSPQDNTSLAHTISSFILSLESLATSPSQTADTQNVVRMADELMLQLHGMTQAIQDLRLQADKDIQAITEQMNILTADIDQLNDDILKNKSFKRDVTDLQDQRDIKIDQLSQYIDIRYFTRSDGDVVIFTSGGTTLVDTVPPILSHNAAANVSPTTTYAEGDFAGIYAGEAIAMNDITLDIRDGQLKGLIELRDNILTDMQTQLDNLAVEIQDTFNQIHNRGVSFPGVSSMEGTRVFVDHAVQTIELDPTSNIDDVTIILFDATNGDQSVTTTLNTIMTAATLSDHGSGGDWTIAQVSAQMQTWLQANGAPNATVDTSSGVMVIELSSDTLKLAFRDEITTTNGSSAGDAQIGFDANGDGTNDKTVSGFSNFFGLNDFFVDSLSNNIHDSAFLSNSYTVPAANLSFTDSTGTMTGSPLVIPAGTSLSGVVALVNANITGITASVVPDGSGSRLRFAHDQGSNFEVTQAAGETFLTDMSMDISMTRRATVLEVRADIKNAPSLISTGTPQWDSDKGASGEYLMSVNENSIITSLTSTFSEVHTFRSAGGLPDLSYSFADYGAAIVSNNSVLAESNERNTNAQQAMTASLQFKSDSVRGVNVDEEMAQLIVFEQAYAAAARVISVIQKMMDILNETVR